MMLKQHDVEIFQHESQSVFTIISGGDDEISWKEITFEEINEFSEMSQIWSKLDWSVRSFSYWFAATWAKN